MDRLSQLKEFYREDPRDPFNLYALALEYKKTDIDQAVKLFRQLYQEHEEYLPVYYPYAGLMAERKELKLAEEIYRKGIDAARNAGDTKTLSELQSAFSDFQFENG